MAKNREHWVEVQLGERTLPLAWFHYIPLADDFARELVKLPEVTGVARGPEGRAAVKTWGKWEDRG